MASYLVVLNIGPVQGFIAAARRTRDLWFGSHVLSEVSKAAARCLQDNGAQLIFPVLTSENLKDEKFTVANRVLAQVTTGDPKDKLTQAQRAAQKCWYGLAEKVQAKIAKEAEKSKLELSKVIRLNIWETQADDILEFYYVWVEVKENDYKTAMKDLKRLEATRKTSRIFKPSALKPTGDASGFGLPKSSLDALRETVLQKELPTELRRRLGLKDGEQLDCPGLVKRLGANPEQFTPIARIALDPWLRLILEKHSVEVKKINEAYEKLLQFDIATWVQGNNGIYEALPYDGELLYPARLQVTVADAKKDNEPERSKLLKALQKFREAAEPLWKKFNEPCPYVALLQADGDKMGKLLDCAEGAKQHRKISTELAKFAKEVPNIVRKEEYRGHCIYSGGDDVLALVPLDGVLGCANELRECFRDLLDPIAKELEAESPTLSVGIGIQHFIETLSSLRELAKRAEKLAKGDDLPESEQRNGLGIIVQTRSGAPIQFRDQWKNNPHERLAGWIRLYTEDKLPDKAAYDLAEAARQLEWADLNLLATEAKRILTRKRIEGGTKAIATDDITRLTNYVEAHGLYALSQELLISRWLAQKVKR